MTDEPKSTRLFPPGPTRLHLVQRSPLFPIALLAFIDALGQVKELLAGHSSNVQGLQPSLARVAFEQDPLAQQANPLVRPQPPQQVLKAVFVNLGLPITDGVYPPALFWERTSFGCVAAITAAPLTASTFLTIWTRSLSSDSVISA
jgi:hypothetical protein